ncbi:MAG TPA: HD domain-containing protein [Gemmatimonadota bacterium]|nr:HD domain-containing protein [Gemmatimonadota bacterium]
MISLSDLQNDPETRKYLDRADEVMGAMGYTEHGRRHAGVVSKRARSLLEALERPQRQCELAGIAAYLHDIGNVVNRDHHAQSGAVLAHEILRKLGMPIEEVIEVVTAIGHHHETDGAPVSDISAAVILADKSDVHRSRVRDKEMIRLDIHDRVNFAVSRSSLGVVGPHTVKKMEGEREGGNGGANPVARAQGGGDTATVVIANTRDDETLDSKPVITLALRIDTTISPVMEYFEIFLPRMILSNRAAERLGGIYKLVINETHLL